MLRFEFEGKLWRYPGNGAWYFITIPKKYAKEISALRDPIKKGFGSVKVQVIIDGLEWHTSIFPDKNSDSYLLPVKKDIRRRKDLQDATTVRLTVTILESQI